jgi:hypothetical protein
MAGTDLPAGKVSEILIYEGHIGILIKHESMALANECGRNDYLILPASYSRYEEAYSMLLAASMANSNVWVYVEGCTQNIPKIKHLAIQK